MLRNTSGHTQTKRYGGSAFHFEARAMDQSYYLGVFHRIIMDDLGAIESFDSSVVGGKNGLHVISSRFTSMSSRTPELMGVRSAIGVIYGWQTFALSMCRLLTYSIMFLAARGEHKGVVMHCSSAWLRCLPLTGVRSRVILAPHQFC